MSTETVEYCLAFTAICLQSSEWAAWAQALFSAAAVIAAIAVVFWQLQTNRAHNMASAQLAAGGLLTYMEQTIAGLDAINQKLLDRKASGYTPSTSSKVMHGIIASLALPQQDELRDLNYGLPRCAVSLRQATNSILQVKTTFKVFAESTDEISAPTLITLHSLTKNAHGVFIYAKRELDNFVPKFEFDENA